MTKLEEYRKKKGLTQQEMANNSDISIGAYNMYENSQRKIPRDKAEIFALILDCNIDDIFSPSTFTNC